MATKNLSMRLQVIDGGKVVNEFDAVGRKGKAALGEITRSARPASRGLKALSGAARAAEGGVRSLAAQAPGLGALGAALGPVGLGLGAVVGVAGLLSVQAHKAAEAIASIGDAADRATVDPALYERLAAALTIEGQKGEGLELSLSTINKRLGEARQGLDRSARGFNALGVSIADAEGRARPFEDVLFDVSDGLSGIEDKAQRAAIAQKLFGDGGLALLPVLSKGSEGLKATFDQAQKLGLLYGGDLIRSTQAVNAQFGIQAQVVGVQMKKAFVQLAPQVAELTEQFSEALPKIVSFISNVGTMVGLWHASLSQQIEDKIDELKRVQDKISKWLGPDEHDSSTFSLVTLVADEKKIKQELRVLKAAQAKREEIRKAATASAAKEMPKIRLHGSGLGTETGSGGKVDRNAFAQALEAQAKRTEALRLEIRLVGKSTVESARLRAETELGAAALKQYGAITRETAVKIAASSKQIARETSTLELRKAAAKRLAESEKARAKAHEEAARASQRARAALAGMFDGAIVNAKSFLGVLGNVAARLAEMAIPGVFGQGPLGGAVNNLLGVGANGLAGLLSSGGSTLTAARSGANIIAGVPFYELGGIVGAGGAMGRAPAKAFRNAPQFASGGLLPGARPVIAHDGELIVPSRTTPQLFRLIDRLDRQGAGGAARVQIIDQRGRDAPPIETENTADGVRVIVRQEIARAAPQIVSAAVNETGRRAASSSAYSRQFR